MIKLGKYPRLVRLRTRGEAVCPISTTVDVFEVTLEYIPRDSVIAIEEFKKLVDSYRGREIYHEELAADLLEKIRNMLNPPYAKVVLKSVYIGVEIEVVAEAGGVPPVYI